MTEACCCPPEAGNTVCENSSQNIRLDVLEPHPSRTVGVCPVCKEKGKPVQGQTVKALLAVSLRQVQEIEYLFCKTRSCPVVYFSTDGKQTFRTEAVRERVYQKEPENPEVFVCCCFRYPVGDILAASSEANQAVLDDINSGIQSGQCACDLRNPQGSCCLGNVRELIKRAHPA